MKEIHINYFTHQHLPMLTSMTSRITPGLSEHIYAGYPITTIPDDQNVVAINVMNILASDVEKYGDSIEKTIMKHASQIPSYDFIKAMLVEDEECVKCKIRGAIMIAIGGMLDPDEWVKVTCHGSSLFPDEVQSSTPRVIEECLRNNFEIKLPSGCAFEPGEHSYLIRK